MSCIMSDELKTLSRRADTLSDMIEQLEYRVTAVEDSYGRALALLEDRLHKIEEQELNEVDERLCRLESPGVWGIDRRATAEPSKTSKGSVAPTRVFECGDCPHPCKLYVDVAADVPDRCPYCNQRANWQEARPVQVQTCEPSPIIEVP